MSAVHTFWWVQGDIGGQAIQFIFTAGPQKYQSSSVKWLEEWAVPGRSNGLDNSGQHTDWSSGLSTNLCLQVDAMIAAAEAFPKRSIQYKPFGVLGLGAMNSNRAANYLAIIGASST